jgi:hypothetical protein
VCREREREIVCCESGTKKIRSCVDRSRLCAEGGSASGWRPDLKERNKARFAGRLIISLCCGDIFVCRGLRKDSLDFDGTGAFLWHPFCVKRAGRGQAGNGGDPGFDDYGWTVLFFSSLRF